MTAPERKRLSSWKEIAAYLQREVRTVIRWEKERGLPVRRVPGGQGRSVFAFTDELDRWASGQMPPEEAAAAPAPRSRRPWMATAGAAVLAVAGAAAVFAGVWPHRHLGLVVLGPGFVEGRDEAGRAVWSHSLPGLVEQPDRRLAQVADLTGDGHPEAIVGPLVGREIGTGSLIALDERGQTMWSASLDDRWTFGAGRFEAPWQPDEVEVFRRGDEAFVAWSVHHLTWWPSMVAVFDGGGKRRGTFVNAGWIRTTRGTLDGRHLIAGGFSNSRNGAAFAVLDAANPGGSSPEDPGSLFECRDCPAGRPVRYLVVDWSDIAASVPTDERAVVISVHPVTGTIELRARQRLSAELIVELSPTFEIRRQAASDSFWEWHRQLETTGAITHPRERCPFREGPVVRVWSAENGWTVDRPTRR
ncbi:MAG TPA: hypothetical protein VM364_19440 [Vicinamibacterales bacterium]|nr:hypothetical protein [Vicinamibacterales bacterium]